MSTTRNPQTNTTPTDVTDPPDSRPITSPSSQAPLSPHASTSPGLNITPSIPTAQLGSKTRAINESRKLLSHVLLQLADRPKPPSVTDIGTSGFETSERDMGSVTLRGTVKVDKKPNARSQKSIREYQEDSDEEIDQGFSTDETYDHLLQLKDVLAMSISQGWRIFDDSSIRQDNAGDNSKFLPFRRSRHTPRSHGKRSRSSSPHQGHIEVPELLSLCISILASVVLEDCRYKIALPRPSRPPNALQILTLNIAQFIVHAHRHDPRIMSQVATAIIPAFSTFPPQMHSRIMSFFESSVLRVVLPNLKHLQASPTKGLKRSQNDEIQSPVDQPWDPVVSIHIDEVNADGQSRQLSLEKAAPPQSPPAGPIQSANNPNQPAHIYHLAFIIPPLLNSILESLDDIQDLNGQSDIMTRFTCLLDLISRSKVDAYNDLLEIIAYQGSKPRRLAIAFAAMAWPKVTGHSIVSSPFFPLSLRTPSQNSKHPYSHHFVPWFVPVERLHPRFHETSHGDCRSCMKPISGFALMCPFCMTAVHFDCYDYPEGNYQIQYSMESDHRIQRIAMFRFSHTELNGSADIVAQHEHQFVPATWFTLCLCYSCKTPLWGCFNQGLKCSRCSMAIHRHCISHLDHRARCGIINFTSRDFTISWDSLRTSSLQYFSALFSCTEQALKACYFEEVAIYHSALQTQLEFLENGMTMGSVILGADGAQDKNKEFELHRTACLCGEVIKSSKLPSSPLTQQYIQDGGNGAPGDLVPFNWTFLEYLTSSLKTSIPQSQRIPQTTSDFLAVDRTIRYDSHSVEATTYSYEFVAMSHVRDILQTDFGLRSPFAINFMIDHLFYLALIDYDIEPFVKEHTKCGGCTFLWPLGLDLSANVETLVSSAEACLLDLDLSTNEFGFLLLTRRLWPNGLSSDYSLKRLTERVLQWILAEDDSLATILREYIAKQRNLPGLCMDLESRPWPLPCGSRPGATNLSNNGGDYVAARRSLLSRYAVPWLLELHNLNPRLYAEITFNSCLENAFKGRNNDINQAVDDTRRSKDNDTILRAVNKLSQASVIFSTFDEIFLQWLGTVVASRYSEKPVPSLRRMFGTEPESLQRASGSMDPTSLSDRPYTSDVDPLRAIVDLASRGPEPLSRALSYVLLLTLSAVNVTTSTFQQLASLIGPDSPGCLQNANALARSVFRSLWLRSLGRQDLQSVIILLHSRLTIPIADSLTSGKDVDVALSIIRHSLASCLLVYGCERAAVLASAIISTSDTQNILSRRKMTTRGSEVADPIIMDPQILTSLEAYIKSDVEEIFCFAIKFLHMFFTESPLLEGFEVDNFILRNGKFLTMCVWSSYDIQREDIAIARTTLLLRGLVVDAEPFQEVLRICFYSTNVTLPDRLSGINRLFHMISDVTSPAFGVEGRQWKSSVTDIFYFFFSSLWTDSEELVRLAVRSSAAALLPAHFEAISQCWDEALLKAPINERLKLVSFLIQLHPHFPNWQVLSWDCMLDTLTDYDGDPGDLDGHRIHGNNIGGNYSTPRGDPDMSRLHVSVLLLGLQMISEGIDINISSLMRLKAQFIQLTGFTKISMGPPHSGQSFHLQSGDLGELPEHAYPCVEALVHVVDAAHSIDLPRSVFGYDEHEDKKVSVLVGAVFVDVALTLLTNHRNLPSLPVLTLKSLLETLHIIIHKADFDQDAFRHMKGLLRQAVLRSTELLSKGISYEVRQLALSIAQAAIKKWHSFLGTTISSIIEIVAGEIAMQGPTAQDSIVINGKLLIGSTLQSFCHSGMLYSIMKRTLKPEFFVVLRQVLTVPAKEATFTGDALCEQLLRDSLPRASECDVGAFQTLVQNISSFVETVYFQNYSSELMTFAGQQLIHLARRMSDGTIEGADPAPLIHIFVLLVQNNKKYTRDVLPAVDIVLRAVLTRLHVAATSLVPLLKVITYPKPKGQESVQGPNDIVQVLYEVLLDGFRIKTKILPSTVTSLIETLGVRRGPSTFSIHPPHDALLYSMADDAYNFLQHHTWFDDHIDNDFKAVNATAKLLLEAANQDPLLFQRLTDPSPDKAHKSPITMRSWNMLLLSVLREENHEWKSLFFAHFPTFTITYSNILRRYVHSGIISPEAATTDINQSHIAMKLWLMLSHSITGSGEAAVLGVWNELWAPYKEFLNVLEVEAQVGQYSTLISLASTSIAELLIYMRTLRTPLALEASVHLAILNHIRALDRADSSSSKVNRAIKSLSEAPVEITRATLLAQISKELIAAERLRVLEIRREHGKVPTDRFRREARFPT